MSGDHNMNQKITGTLFSVAQVDAIEREWADKLQTYINIHDAVVRDNDKAISLLRQCLDEMQYAGWNKPNADQQGRWNVFSAVLDYLYPTVECEA